MAKFPALPLWTDAWVADTKHLSRCERGTYFDLLVLMWRSPLCRVPADPIWLCKHLGVNRSEFDNELIPLINEFCRKDGNWYYQKRLRLEYEYVLSQRRLQSERSKSRWRKEKNNATAYASGINPAYAPTPTPTPIYNGSVTDDKNNNTNGNVISAVVNNVSKNIKMNGNGYRSADSRIQYAIQKALGFLPGRDDAERWLIAQAAEDINNPNHQKAVSMMLTATKKARVGWVSPERRKKDEHDANTSS